MKGIKIIMLGLSLLIFLTIFQIGILIGGNKGAEAVLGYALVPLFIVVLGLLKKD